MSLMVTAFLCKYGIAIYKNHFSDVVAFVQYEYGFILCEEEPSRTK